MRDLGMRSRDGIKDEVSVVASAASDDDDVLKWRIKCRILFIFHFYC